jgi:hypothetical protein
MDRPAKSPWNSKPGSGSMVTVLSMVAAVPPICLPKVSAIPVIRSVQRDQELCLQTMLQETLAYVWPPLRRFMEILPESSTLATIIESAGSLMNSSPAHGLSLVRVNINSSCRPTAI